MTLDSFSKQYMVHLIVSLHSFLTLLGNTNFFEEKQMIKCAVQYHNSISFTHFMNKPQ